MICDSHCKRLPCFKGLLAKKVVGEKAQKLVVGIDEALGAMTGMLNTLLDINRIEAGAIEPEIVDFPVNDLLDRLKEELTYHTQAAGLDLHVMPCALSIRSDPAFARADDPQSAVERPKISPSAAGFSSGAAVARPNCVSRSGTPGSASPSRS